MDRELWLSFFDRRRDQPPLHSCNRHELERTRLQNARSQRGYPDRRSKHAPISKCKLPHENPCPHTCSSSVSSKTKIRTQLGNAIAIPACLLHRLSTES